MDCWSDWEASAGGGAGPDAAAIRTTAGRETGRVFRRRGAVHCGREERRTGRKGRAVTTVEERKAGMRKGEVMITTVDNGNRKGNKLGC